MKSIQDGRVFYVEPNDMEEGYNIPPMTEDYSIYMDLQIEKFDRNTCGQVENGGEIINVVWSNKGDNKVSILRGTKDSGGNYLTNSVTEATFSDLMGGNINAEGIGIESVNIDFNQWFYPIVNIKFIDVRGISLMGIEDYNHTASGESAETSLFNSFFVYPYPKITLQVKGFYGQSVSFNLCMNDFRTNFNSTTGNFETNINLIGYMYGLLTDIDMKYLIAAPECEYGGRSYWNDRISSGAFTFDQGEPMITLMEVYEKFTTASSRVSKETSSSGTYDQYGHSSTELNILKNILEVYDKVINNISGNYVKNNNGYVLLISDKELNNEQINREFRSELVRLIQDYNGKYESDLPYPNGDDNIDKVYTYENLLIKLDGKITAPNNADKEVKVFNDIDEMLKEGETYKKIIKYEYLVNYLNNCIGKPPINNIINGNNFLYCYDGDDFYKKINEKINELNSLTDGLLKDLRNEQVSITKGIFGFTLNIENIVKLIMAHLETFLNCVYTTMNNVKQDSNNRTIGNLGISIKNTDIVNKSGDVFVPPFVGFTDSDGEAKWPEEIINYPMEECSLINGILNAAMSVAKKKESVDISIKNYNEVAATNRTDYIPTLVSDLLTGNTPYGNIYDNYKGTIKIDELMSYFALRAVNFFGLEEGKNIDDSDNDELFNKKCENFAIAEAENYYLSNPIMDVELNNKLKNGSMINDITNYLTSQKNPYYANGMALHSLTPNSQAGVLPSSVMVGKTSKTYIWMKCFKGNWGYSVPINFTSIEDISKKLNNSKNIELDENFYVTKRNDSNNVYLNQFVTNIISDANFINNLITFKTNTQEKYPTILEEWDISDETMFKTCASNSRVTFITNSYYTNNSDICNILPMNKRSDTDIDKLPHLFSSEVNNRFKRVDNYKKQLNVSDGLYYETVFKDNTKYTDYYISNIPYSYQGSLYGHPFFYAQNNIADQKIRLYTKGLLFLHSLPTDEDKFIVEGVSKKITAYNEVFILFMGGLLWRKKYYNANKKDCIQYPKDYQIAKENELLRDEANSFDNHKGASKSIFSKPLLEARKTKGDYKKFTININKSLENLLIKYFIDWCENEYSYINNEMELKPIKGEFNEISFKKVSDGLLSLNGTAYEKYLNSNYSNNFFKNYYQINESDASEHGMLLLNRINTEVNNRIKKILLNKVLLLNPFRYDKSDGNIYIGNIIPTAFIKFRDRLFELYGDKIEQVNNSQEVKNIVESNSNKDFKLATYQNLKGLYDRWLSSNTFNKWKIDNDENDNIFKSFIFIDSFYEPIGSKLMINIDSFFKKLFDSKNLNVFNFLSGVMHDNNLLFMTLPIYNDWNNTNTIKDMFTPIPYYKMNKINTNSTYVCMFVHEASKNLNIGEGSYSYKDDSFSLIDVDYNVSQIKPNILKQVISDKRNKLSIIPAFGVTYGKQNQNFFKNISVGMDNPQLTIESLKATQDIAKTMGEDNKISYSSQDLYKVFSNRSYTCEVTMMGCAPLLPLMYFQLNNIPMFKGTYIVIKVSHILTPGNMETKFTGVRLSRNMTPLVSETFNVKSIVDNLSNVPYKSSYIDNSQTPPTVSDYSKLPSTYDDGMVVHPQEGEWENYDNVIKLKNKNGGNLIKFNIGDNVNGYNGLNDHMKYFVVSLAKTINKNNNYILKINSGKRKDGGTSDHNYGNALDLMADSYNGENKSIELFDIILNTNEFFAYIKQLIWENKPKSNNSHYNMNLIDNCIHISSLGKGKTFAPSVFVSEKLPTVTATIRVKSNSNLERQLPSMFLNSIAQSVSDGRIKSLLQVYSFNGMVTKEELLKFKVEKTGQ